VVYHASLATDDDLSGPPVNVVELKEDDLPGSQPEAGKQQ
jgi:hypothetical protein